jgi:neutral trehalase
MMREGKMTLDTKQTMEAFHPYTKIKECRGLEPVISRKIHLTPRPRRIPTPELNPGDTVVSMHGWQEYFMASPQEMRLVKQSIQTLSVYIGALDMADRHTEEQGDLF